MRLIHLLLIVALTCPVNTTANENKNQITIKQNEEIKEAQKEQVEEVKKEIEPIKQNPVIPAVLPPKPVKAPAKPANQLAQGDYGGWCVEYAKNYFGVTGQTWGYGGSRLKVDPTPQINTVVVMYGHVAIVMDIQGDELVLKESNYHWNKKVTVGRRVKITDKSIRGYYKP